MGLEGYGEVTMETTHLYDTHKRCSLIMVPFEAAPLAVIIITLTMRVATESSSLDVYRSVAVASAGN